MAAGLEMAHYIAASIPICKVCFPFSLLILVRHFTLSLDDIHMCFGINSADILFEQMKIWKELGILPMTFYPAQADNLILLCNICHSGHDCQCSGWIILPQDLDLFIHFEKQRLRL